MNKVFLPQPNERFDVSGAKKFGEVVHLLDFANPFNTTSVAEKLVESLEENNFNPEKDYLCMTGSPLVLAILLAVAFEKYGTIRMLMFDAKESNYRERRLECLRSL